LAVSFIVIVTGVDPQEKVITPPAATAATTASEVQLAGVPSPITRAGREVSSARPSAGTGARPLRLPGGGSGGDGTAACGSGLAVTGADGTAEAAGVTHWADGAAHPASTIAVTTTAAPP
jgi:hypothetical protein